MRSTLKSGCVRPLCHSYGSSLTPPLALLAAEVNKGQVACRSVDPTYRLLPWLLQLSYVHARTAALLPENHFTCGDLQTLSHWKHSKCMQIYVGINSQYSDIANIDTFIGTMNIFITYLPSFWKLQSSFTQHFSRDTFRATHFFFFLCKIHWIIIAFSATQSYRGSIMCTAVRS